jgi:ribosomal protein S12 methylthiotransferase accessory factor
VSSSALEDVSPTPLPESLRRLETLVSPYAGIVRSVHTTLAATDDAPFVTASCELAETRAAIGAAIDANAISWGTSRSEAVAAAVGEAAERYSAGLVPDGEVVLASADELGGAAVDPARFALFHPRQYADPGFRARPFTRSTRVRWVRGFEVASGRPAWLPVQLVYLAGLPRAGDEELIGYATSNGLACRPTFEEAILSGLLEVVERDAFALTWYNRLSLPRVRAEEDSELSSFLEAYVAPTGLPCRVVDLSVFHRVPTLLAVVRGRGDDGVALSIGAASAPTASLAARKAITEAFATRAWARQLRLRRPGDTFADGFDGVSDFDDHVLLYALPAHAARAAFLDASTETRALDEVPGLEAPGIRTSIEANLERLRAGSGARAYAVDVTAPDVRAAGLHVVKVLVPELCQLDVLHRARFLGGERLYLAPWRLGLRSAPLGWDEVNPDPHPFP